MLMRIKNHIAKLFFKQDEQFNETLKILEKAIAEYKKAGRYAEWLRNNYDVTSIPSFDEFEG